MHTKYHSFCINNCIFSINDAFVDLDVILVILFCDKECQASHVLFFPQLWLQRVLPSSAVWLRMILCFLFLFSQQISNLIFVKLRENYFQSWRKKTVRLWPESLKYRRWSRKTKEVVLRILANETLEYRTSLISP